MTYPKTFYSDRLGRTDPRRRLEGSAEAEVCVVGGGLAGLTTALEIARAGRTVILLEAEEVGFGASGRNGGFVGPAWSNGHAAIARRVGADAADGLHRLSIEGVDIVSANIDALALPGVDRVFGKLSVARTESREAFLRERDRLEAKFGQRLELWETAQVRAVLDTPKYFQALHSPTGFHIDPLAYARGLACEIERLGGRIYGQSRVRRLQAIGSGKRVVTDHGAADARHVVIACGGYTGDWAAALHRAYLPIATYVLITEAAPDLIARAVRTPFAVGDQRRAGDYYRLVEGGRRLLWGGRITTRVSEPRRLAELLRRTMVATFPQLDDLKVDGAWSGLMAYARHLMPQIGRLEDGVWHCTAFGGHGLNTTAIGGKVIAEAILGESDRWRMFAPFGLDWNGGPAGRAAVQGVYWWLQARDALAEARPGTAA